MSQKHYDIPIFQTLNRLCDITLFVFSKLQIGFVNHKIMSIFDRTKLAK